MSVLPVSQTVAQDSSRLRINGSTTVNPVVSQAAEILRKEQKAEITVDTLGGSSGGIEALARGRAEMAMSSRPLNDRDKLSHPSVDFVSTSIGADALALVVSKDIWDGGIRSLTKKQVRALYEGEITRWSSLGGPDQRVAFFNKEPGRGTWEVFADWLYGDSQLAPRVRLLEVGSNEEARTKVRSTRGAITQLSAAWVDGVDTFAIAIETESGPVFPTVEEIDDGRYPLVRPLLVVTNGPAEGTAEKLIRLLTGERGQKIVVASGFLPLHQPSEVTQNTASSASPESLDSTSDTR